MSTYSDNFVQLADSIQSVSGAFLCFIPFLLKTMRIRSFLRALILMEMYLKSCIILPTDLSHSQPPAIMHRSTLFQSFADPCGKPSQHPAISLRSTLRKPFAGTRENAGGITP
jgi:hypothetical protein